MAVQPSPIFMHSAQTAARVDRTRQSGLSASSPTLYLLAVEANEFALRSCCDIARGMGFIVHAAGTGAEARRLLQLHAFDVVLLDWKMEDAGLLLLEEIRGSRPRASVVVTTSSATVFSAVEAMRTGAVDYLTKPFAMEELETVLERAVERVEFDLKTRQLRDQLRSSEGMSGLIGASPEMEKLYRMLSKIIPATLPVLISGEIGTGKKLVAQCIHTNGPNASAPFLPIDCGTVPSILLETELFGDASAKDRYGDLCAAGALTVSGATVYLSDVDALPFDLQGRLLRALQEKAVFAAGSADAVPLRARLLVGTSGDLKRMVDLGTFRRELYLRLNVVNLRIPALRDRSSDVPLLAEHFLTRLSRNRGVHYSLSSDAAALLQAYDWPGNVRDMEYALERAASLGSGPVLGVNDLTTQLENFRRGRESVPTLVDARTPFQSEGIGFNRTGDSAGSPLSMADRERRAILSTLADLHGDKLMAAKLLGIGKTTLYRKLKAYGIKQA